MRNEIILGLIFFASSCSSSEDHPKSTLKSEQEKHDEEQKKHSNANDYMHAQSYENLVASFESNERTSYQQPEKVIEFLGDLKGKKIMDLGSGTGYFTFRLYDGGASVIAADVDENFQEYIRNKKDSLEIPDDEFELRLIPFDSPALKPGEVDMVLVVNTYHHIENRTEYFKEIKNGLKPNGKLVIIDFKKEDIPVGPPEQMKMTPEEIQSELTKSGFKKIEVNVDLLKYQYILVAEF